MAKVRRSRDSKGRFKKNPQFRTGPGGVVYPLRGSTGWGGDYSPRKAREAPGEARLRRKKKLAGIK